MQEGQIIVFSVSDSSWKSMEMLEHSITPRKPSQQRGLQLYEILTPL